MKVGVIGLGSMGSTHIDVYARRTDVQVVAVSDRSEDALHGRACTNGNIAGQAVKSAGWFGAAKYRDAIELIHDPQVEIVDICLPTPLHRYYVEAALAAGKHVLVEKPLAATASDGRALAARAERAGVIAMPAMCMRFWPGWDWLKDAVSEGRYGRVLSAQFRRLASHPGGGFYSSRDCGGAVLDLHIHDTDFIHYVFGPPPAVFCRGYVRDSGALDHVVTHYLYDDGPLVVAEGGWTMVKGYGFTMQFCVNFEHATAVFDLAANPVLRLIHDGKSEGIPITNDLGYAAEIDYFLGCVRRGELPRRVTFREAAGSIAIIEAEVESAKTGHIAHPDY